MSVSDPSESNPKFASADPMAAGVSSLGESVDAAGDADDLASALTFEQQADAFRAGNLTANDRAGA